MMKKLFFFKASTSNNGPNNLAPSPSKDNSSGDGLRSKKSAYEDDDQYQTGPYLRRCRSYSSGTFPDSGVLRTQSDSPCSNSSNLSQKQSRSSW